MSFRLLYILLVFIMFGLGEGMASYYHHRFHGRRSSSGRILDVSASAAERLGFIDRGVAKVRLEVVPGPLDLRYLDLIYPKIPYLEVDYLRPEPPYRIRFAR